MTAVSHKAYGRQSKRSRSCHPHYTKRRAEAVEPEDRNNGNSHFLKGEQGRKEKEEEEEEEEEKELRPSAGG